ncbi:MAG: cytochrome b [Lautropia sp.]
MRPGQPKANRYTRLTIVIHWLTLLVMIATFATIELRVLFAKGTVAREEIKGWHFALGMVILLMTIARMLNRAASKDRPPVSPAPPAWQRVLADGAHWVLYAALIGMPLLGWFTLSAAGKPVPLFFGVELPMLTGTDKALAKDLEALHKQIGSLLYYVIGLHAAAAIYHHVVRKDDTLRRMLPADRHTPGAAAGDHGYACGRDGLDHAAGEARTQT